MCFTRNQGGNGFAFSKEIQFGRKMGKYSLFLFLSGGTVKKSQQCSTTFVTYIIYYTW